MSIFKRSALHAALAALCSLGALGFSSTAAAIPAGWTCVGTCGDLGPNGVVTASPDGGQYLYVSTDGASSSDGLNLGAETNGTVLRSSVFSAKAADELAYHFNFVTSDGAGFADYAWSRLFTASNNLVALLFTARTTPNGNSVPGFGMPAIAATIDPATVVIQSGTTWSPLGSSSGRCFSTGCGHTGWVQSTYEIADAGNYYLEFGVVNWADTAFQTGMAIDGILVGGEPIDPEEPNGVPEPGSLALLGLGLLGLSASRRRRQARRTDA